MGVNGVTNYTISDQYVANTTEKEKVNSKAPEKETTVSTSAEKSETGVVYEKSESTVTDKRKALVAQLKMEQEERQKQLLDIVRKSITGQGNSFAMATTDDMWKFLASGKVTVDEATRKKAQEDISEDGYWGVKKTSDRIIDFAKALTGNDASKIGLMRDAFEKGFKQATKTWGKELPSISQQTYKAVMDKFDAWEKEANSSQKEENKDSGSTDMSIQMNTDS